MKRQPRHVSLCHYFAPCRAEPVRSPRRVVCGGQDSDGLLVERACVQHGFQGCSHGDGLSPDRSDIDPFITNDVRQILSGLATVIGGVWALRTHGGDAHRREKGFARVDARIGRLAIHAASTAALFLIETWQRKFPTRPLPMAEDPEV